MKHFKKSNRLLKTRMVASVCVLIAISTQSVIADEANIQPKIYNGEKTTIQENPYMVALLHSNEADTYQAQFCGGTLIAKNWVLTAAHCVFDKVAGHVKATNTIDILVNRSDLSSTVGERIATENIIVHQSYNAQTHDNDIALIQLKSPANATPIELLSEFSDQDGMGNNGKALGWGVTYEHFSATFNDYYGDYVDDVAFTHSLQKASLPIINNATCQSAINYLGRNLTNNMMCAGFEDGRKDVCHGDSGGPLVVYDAASNTWRQVGITSWGHPYCSGNGTYGVYTRVKNYKNYISDRICSAEEKPAVPTLQTTITGALVELNWSMSDRETTYQIIYSRHGAADWHSLDMDHQTRFSITLPVGSDYDVKINANKGNCESYGELNVGRVQIL
ncbi:MAG: serine protease [Methylococcaceae bacterium]|nr:serine protease [Methylococcaceae bacterium]